jgi:hypothetical protein
VEEGVRPSQIDLDGWGCTIELSRLCTTLPPSLNVTVGGGIIPEQVIKIGKACNMRPCGTMNGAVYILVEKQVYAELLNVWQDPGIKSEYPNLFANSNRNTKSVKCFLRAVYDIGGWFTKISLVSWGCKDLFEGLDFDEENMISSMEFSENSKWVEATLNKSLNNYLQIGVVYGVNDGKLRLIQHKEAGKKDLDIYSMCAFLEATSSFLNEKSLDNEENSMDYFKECLTCKGSARLGPTFLKECLSDYGYGDLLCDTSAKQSFAKLVSSLGEMATPREKKKKESNALPQQILGKVSIYVPGSQHAVTAIASRTTLNELGHKSLADGEEKMNNFIDKFFQISENGCFGGLRFEGTGTQHSLPSGKGGDFDSLEFSIKIAQSCQLLSTTSCSGFEVGACISTDTHIKILKVTIIIEYTCILYFLFILILQILKKMMGGCSVSHKKQLMQALLNATGFVCEMHKESLQHWRRCSYIKYLWNKLFTFRTMSDVIEGVPEETSMLKSFVCGRWSFPFLIFMDEDK